jgi:hypothetical protein
MLPIFAKLIEWWDGAGSDYGLSEELPRVPDPAPKPPPTPEQINALAYWYWQQRVGRGIPGSAESDWLWAQRELSVGEISVSREDLEQQIVF